MNPKAQIKYRQIQGMQKNRGPSQEAKQETDRKPPSAEREREQARSTFSSPITSLRRKDPASQPMMSHKWKKIKTS
jgi:hypothetical protein